MNAVLTILTVQALIGAFDNLWHHEIRERLPWKRAARTEVALHAVRELLYCVMFLLLGWYVCQGLWGILLAVLFIVEIIVTVSDFLIEDQTRKLSKSERILHTAMAVNFGIIITLFFPVLIQWISLPTTLVQVNYGILSWFMTLFAIGVFIWGIRDLAAVVLQSRAPAWQRHQVVAGKKLNPRHILVAGATGFIGRSLCRTLIRNGDRVTVLSRDAEKAYDIFGPYTEVVTSADQVQSESRFDAIIHLAGAPVLSVPWTRRRKRKLIDSRVSVTMALEQLVSRLIHKPAVFIAASAIGYYGIREDEFIDERASLQGVFQSFLCREVEQAAGKFTQYGLRVCYLRIGVVLGRDGGFFPAMMRPIRFGLGTVFGTGRQWLSWIYLDDLVRVFLFTLSQEYLSGPVNATAPEPVRQKEFMQLAAAKVNRPLFMKLPRFIPEKLLGEMSQLLIDGQRVVPAKLLESGFRFNKPDLDSAVTALLDKRPANFRAEPGVAIATDNPILLFDGICVFCSRSVMFIRKRIKQDAVEFVPMQGERGQEILQQLGFPLKDFKTFVFIDGSSVFTKSSAGIRLLDRMDFPWSVFAVILKIIPGAVLDPAYDVLARNRYKILGKNEQCYIP